MPKRTGSLGAGSLGSAALTGLSTLVVSAFAALVGVVIAREFGRSEETDGFFAAYGVFIVIVLAAQAIRVAVLPDLARARAQRRLAGELTSLAAAVALVALPLVAAAEAGAEPAARLLAGDGSEAAQATAAEALRWMVPAAVLHLFAGLLASGLAALDDYATAAAAYAGGSAAGLLLMLWRLEADGIVAVAWGMTLNAAVCVAVPLAVLVLRSWRERMPLPAARPSGAPPLARLRAFTGAAVLTVGLQGLYVACLPFAAREGTGAVSSFGYAYLGASALVAVTASSIGLVSAVPLTRLGVRGEQSARHVVSCAWLALAVVAGAAAVFALAGEAVVNALLGPAYAQEAGAEIGELVVALSPWMVASAGVSAAFPLSFVSGRTRALPWIAVGALALHVCLAYVLSRALGLDGLALALAGSSLFVLGALLSGQGALEQAFRGVLTAAAVIGLLAALAFVPPALVLEPAAAAGIGSLLYLVLLGLVRPRGLVASWHYLRTLS